MENFSQVMEILSQTQSLTEAICVPFSFKKSLSILSNYPFDTARNFQSFLLSTQTVENMRQSIFRILKEKQYRALRLLRIAQFLAESLNWDSIQAYRLIVSSEKIGSKTLRKLADHFGYSTLPKALESNIDSDLKEILSQPILRHEYCIRYLVERIKRLSDQVKHPLIRKLGAFLITAFTVSEKHPISIAEEIQDPHIRSVVIELQKMNGLLTDENFPNLWKGLCLIHFNNEKLELLFAKETQDGHVELHRCLNAMMNLPVF